MITVRKTNAIAAATLLCGALMLQPALAAGDAEQGEVLAYTCLGCHGIPGYRNAYPSYRVPKIGGQKADYIETALKAYRAGDRDHLTMQANGSPLSDDDIADLAAYFQGDEAALDYVTSDMIKDIPAAATCLACHGGGASGLMPTPATLSGQEESYIVQALNQYKSGARKNNVMTAFAAGLTDADIAAIAKLWSKQDGVYTPRAKD